MAGEQEYYKISAKKVKWFEECFSYWYGRYFDDGISKEQREYASGVIFMAEEIIHSIDKP